MSFPFLFFSGSRAINFLGKPGKIVRKTVTELTEILSVVSWIVNVLFLLSSLTLEGCKVLWLTGANEGQSVTQRRLLVLLLRVQNFRRVNPLSAKISLNLDFRR